MDHLKNDHRLDRSFLIGTEGDGCSARSKVVSG